MAIYQPPKQSSLGGILQSSGDGAMAIGAGMAVTGIGTLPGLAIAGAGAIAKFAGTVISGNQDKRNEAYQVKYQNRVQGEENLYASAQSINNQNAANYNQVGINSSLKAINNYITPQAGGTGIVNQRLV